MAGWGGEMLPCVSLFQVKRAKKVFVISQKRGSRLFAVCQVVPSQKGYESVYYMASGIDEWGKKGRVSLTKEVLMMSNKV